MKKTLENQAGIEAIALHAGGHRNNPPEFSIPIDRWQALIIAWQFK